MQVIINCQHLDLTDALQDRVEDKVRKACAHTQPPPATCNVHLRVDGHVHGAEIVIHHQGHDFSAHATDSGDMYAALDGAAAKLRRQLEDFHRRQGAHR